MRSLQSAGGIVSSGDWIRRRRYVTLVGSNPLFHLPHDRWPHAVDAGAVARISVAASRVVVALTR